MLDGVLEQNRVQGMKDVAGAASIALATVWLQTQMGVDSLSLTEQLTHLGRQLHQLALPIGQNVPH